MTADHQSIDGHAWTKPSWDDPWWTPDYFVRYLLAICNGLEQRKGMFWCSCHTQHGSNTSGKVQPLWCQSSKQIWDFHEDFSAFWSDHGLLFNITALLAFFIQNQSTDPSKFLRSIINFQLHLKAAFITDPGTLGTGMLLPWMWSDGLSFKINFKAMTSAGENFAIFPF